MKKMILVIATLFASLTTMASDCKELVQRFAQDEKVDTIYQCKLTSTTVGNSSYSYDKMCFSSSRSWINNYRDISYKTYRYGQGGVDDYAYLTIVTQKENGLVREGYAQKDGSVLTLGDGGHSSGTTGQSWIEETVVDLNSFQITFNTYDKHLFKKDLTYSAAYQCEQVQ